MPQNNTSSFFNPESILQDFVAALPGDTGDAPQISKVVKHTVHVPISWFGEHLQEVVFIILGVGLILGGLFMAKDFGNKTGTIVVKELRK